MDVSSVQQNCETEQLSIGKIASLANHATVEELVNKKGAEIAGKICDTVELKSKHSKAGERSMKEHASIEEYTIRRRSCNDVTHLIVASLDATPNSSSENIGKKLNAVSLEFPPEEEVEKTSVEEMQVLIENGINQSHLGNVAKKSRGGSKKNTGKSTKSKHAPRSVDIGRVLRSRSLEKGKDPEPSKISQEHGAGASGENRRKKKKKQMKNVADDEFSRTRRHLRYLLHRMAYEQNFIDAYAGEGWRGQSAEKLRPEKELQHAKSEIFRWKLKIRDLFQRIDLSIAEGRLPQSLFDSEGEIDSEDIFCSKCGLQDVTLENDIILCDGTCDRAFHQYCVQPALLKEDIPSGDEGWLCPGCDCKDDCLDLLNEAQGTTLSILDSWKKVYPEAAAGKTLDSNLELPSDDSEDNDYNPDDPEEEEEEKEVAPANEQNLQLPSDDSQDDDFDPDAADMDEEVKQESSDSDFSSASEDLNLIVDTNGSPYETSAKDNEIMSGKVKVGRGKRSSLNDELASLLETDTNQGGFSLIAPRREVERLDYKKLFDEQYGHVSTDSSDEEYFDAADSPKRQREDNAYSEKTPQKRARKKLISGGTSDSLLKLNKVPSEASSCSASAKMLGEAATQLPSDDSEDEDFDADATDVDEEVKLESSDSDFSSASEDLNLVVDANGSPHENSAMVNDFMPGQVKSGRDKRPPLNDELSSLVETDTSQGEPSPIAPRREVERLDYKKLYDEQYGNLSTDSSDEEFTDAADAPKRQKKNNADSEKTPKRRAHKKLNTEGTSDSPLKSKKVPSKPGSRSASAKTLGEATTQGLLIAFKENQNPERAAREKLASELGITVQQVTKWFGNARWSYRHTPSFASKLADIPSKGTSDQINQAEDKGADQSGEPSDVKAHIFNTTYSHQKAGKRDKPKDDSQDDDFDPDAADVDDEVKQESYVSDFSSASEDLHLIANTNGSPHENSAMANELISGQNKEQYGIVSIDAPKRRRKSNENSEKTPKNKARKKLITGTTRYSPSKSNNVPSETGSRSASAKTLGAGTQGLLISFKKNQNPDRATRQKLATEFGITVQQVTKWFGNARWSYRHTPSFASKLADIPSKGTSAQINQIEDIQHNSAEDVEGADRSEEPRDLKAHIPMDNTKNTTNSHQKVGKRGKTKGKKSAKSSAKSKNTPKNQ